MGKGFEGFEPLNPAIICRRLTTAPYATSAPTSMAEGRDLAYLSEDHPAFNAHALQWAQQFAFHNRNEMMDRVLTDSASPSTGQTDGKPISKYNGSTAITISRRRKSIAAGRS